MVKPPRLYARGDRVRLSPTAKHWAAGREGVVDQYTSPTRLRVMLDTCGITCREADPERLP